MSDLRKQEPIEIKIETKTIILMSLLTAVFFFLLGVATMHYPANMGWI